MPIYYDGTNNCEKCGKRFQWVHFELERSNMRSGVFRVERIPEQPKAKQVFTLDEKHTEYVVECPYCWFLNHFVCEAK